MMWFFFLSPSSSLFCVSFVFHLYMRANVRRENTFLHTYTQFTLLAQAEKIGAIHGGNRFLLVILYDERCEAKGNKGRQEGREKNWEEKLSDDNFPSQTFINYITCLWKIYLAALDNLSEGFLPLLILSSLGLIASKVKVSKLYSSYWRENTFSRRLSFST